MADEQSPPENLPAVIERPPVVTEEGLLTKWTDQRSYAATSLDMESDSGKADYLRCLQKADHGGQDSVDTLLLVRDWLVHPVELMDPVTGELRACLRLVLMLNDGSTVGTTGPAVLSTWRHATQAAMYGRGPFDPPLRLTLGKVKGSGPFPYLFIKSLERVRQETPAKKK